MRTRKSTGGFTLLELLIVVAIVGITAALAAPGMMTALSQRKANAATSTVVRLSVLAYNRARSTGRAHLLFFQGGGTNAATIAVYQGRFNRCGTNDWATLTPGLCSDNVNCLREVLMNDYQGNSHPLRMSVDGAPAGWICYDSMGEMYFAEAGGIFAQTPPEGTNEMRFRFTRLDSAGSAIGVERQVIFPFGATAMVNR